MGKREKNVMTDDGKSCIPKTKILNGNAGILQQFFIAPRDFTYAR